MNDGQRKVVRSHLNSLAELRNEISRVHGISTPFTPQIFVVHSRQRKICKKTCKPKKYANEVDFTPP